MSDEWEEKPWTNERIEAVRAIITADDVNISLCTEDEINALIDAFKAMIEQHGQPKLFGWPLGTIGVTQPEPEPKPGLAPRRQRE